MGWHRPPSRSPAPRRRRGRRTGSEKARVLSRLLASYSVQAFRIRLVIVSLARRPSSCLGLLSPPRTAFHSSPPEHVERASLCTAKPRGHFALPARCDVPERAGGREGRLRVTHALRNLKGMPAGAREPRSDPRRAAPRPPAKRPMVAARHRVLRDTFPPSLHLSIFQAPQLG